MTVTAATRALAMGGGLVLASTTAFAQQADVGVLMKTLANPYWGAMAEGVRAGLADTDSVTGEVQAVQSEQAVEQQLNLCRSIMQSDPDALAVAAINSVNLLPCLSDATAQDLPIVDIDANLDPDQLAEEGVDITFAISSNNRLAGAKAADYLIEHTDQASGSVLIIEGLAGNVTSQARRDGFRNRLQTIAPGWEVEASLPGDWDRLKAANITRDTLTQNPDLDAIYAANDTMALGAVETVYSRNVQDQVMVIGTDGNAQAVESIQNGRLDASVAQFPYLVGYRAITRLADAMAGEDVPDRIYVDTLVIDQEVMAAGEDDYPMLQYLR